MSQNKKAHHYPTKIMGCGMVITAVHHDPQVAWDGIRAAEKEMRRIETLISSWQENSQTDLINQSAGIKPVQVDEELFQLINRSIKVSRLTQGAFDISGTLSRYFWNFNNTDSSLPTDKDISTLRYLIDFNKIKLDRSCNTVYLKESGMKIGFGGIGKGYAAQRAKTVMMKLGVNDGLINASGDLLCWGNPPNSIGWEISIPDPLNPSYNKTKVKINHGSVVTSGSNEHYTIVDGIKYSHIINPRTGMPVTHTTNVTVLSPDAEFGDALATAISVLPIEEGIGLVNRLNGVECMIIDDTDSVHFSKTLKNNIDA